MSKISHKKLLKLKKRIKNLNFNLKKIAIQYKILNNTHIELNRYIVSLEEKEDFYKQAYANSIKTRDSLTTLVERVQKNNSNLSALCKDQNKILNNTVNNYRNILEDYKSQIYIYNTKGSFYRMFHKLRLKY